MITTSGFEKNYIAENARRIGAKKILEIGAFKGQTTAVLSEVAGADGQVVVLDPMTWASTPASIGEHIDAWFHPFSYEKAFWKNVGRSPYKNVKLLKQLSNDVALLSDPSSDLQGFDLIFIDADHTYDGVRADLINWGHRVRPGGIILMHDVRSRFPGVLKAFQEFSTINTLKATFPKRGSVGMYEILSPTRFLATAPSKQNDLHTSGHGLGTVKAGESLQA